MATTTVAPLRGVLDINWKKWGWQEVYDFPEMPVATAQMHVQNLAILRSYLLPVAAVIAYGRVSLVGQSRKSVLGITSPIPGKSTLLTTPPDNFLDNPATCLLFRGDGESFSKTFRHIHALPDSSIQDMTLQDVAPGGSWVTAFHGAAPAVAASATWAAALKLYLTYWVSVCNIVRKGRIPGPGSTTIDGYNCYQLDDLQFRDVRDVKVGRPFDTPRARRLHR